MTDVRTKILVVEDEPQMQRLLRASLVSEGHRCIQARNASEALTLAKQHNPDVVVLDLGLPDGDGMDVMREIRAWGRIPVIVVSARDREDDKIRALDAGADDYLTKPFGVRELMARIRVAVRHSSAGSSEPVLGAGDVTLDLDKREVRVSGREVHLTPNEYRLLCVLMKSADKVLTHRQLLTEVWGPAYATQSHYLRVYMGQLRYKLEREPARPKHLVTEPGVGYRFKSAP